MTDPTKTDNWTGREARFRRILRWFPASYRAERSDEILEVLRDNSSAGSDRSERRALLALGAKVWSRRALSNDPAVGSRAMAIASVLVPALSLFVAGHAITVSLTDPGYLRYGATGPGWVLWVAAVITLLSGSARQARWISVAAIVAFTVGLSLQVQDNNFGTAVQEFAWIPCMAATLLLSSPERVRHGRELLRLPVIWAVAAVAAALGVSYVLIQVWYWSFGFGIWPEWVRTSVFVALPLLAFGCLVFKLTRAMLPIVAVFVGPIFGAAGAAQGFGNFMSDPQPPHQDPWPPPDWTALSSILIYPIIAFVLTRVVTAIVDRISLPSQDAQRSA